MIIVPLSFFRPSGASDRRLTAPTSLPVVSRPTTRRRSEAQVSAVRSLFGKEAHVITFAAPMGPGLGIADGHIGRSGVQPLHPAGRQHRPITMVDGPHRTPSIAPGVTRMAMGERMTTTLVERTEVLMDTWRASKADGVIDLAEFCRIDAALELVYRGTVDVDEATAITVAMLRNGPESQRVERLMGERRSRLRLVVRNDNPEDPRAA